jgi:hypothetical protein
MCNSNKFVKLSRELVQSVLDRRGYRKSGALIAQSVDKFKERIPDSFITFINEDNPRKWRIVPKSELNYRSIGEKSDSSRMDPVVFTKNG